MQQLHPFLLLPYRNNWIKIDRAEGPFILARLVVRSTRFVETYPGMLWWMEKDGLVIDTVTPEASRLTEFDRRAGKARL